MEKKSDLRDKHTKEEKLRAAYALNMCSVSVSQIVDYKDEYILEQEYEAILNNLNLKQMPKDEALLKIIVELLNTITFFRISDIKKKQIEKKYQRKIKNAIWSAIPSLSVVVSSEPVAIAYSIATQIGIGYMNYRKEKYIIDNEKEDSEVELRITAIEQFDSLKRELFSTAWRLADEYDFEDEWRLTEKQIKQYNDILMDQNEYRKYTRLEALEDKFVAYPPFWYFYGHTANYIAENGRKKLLNLKENDDSESYKEEVAVVKKYTELAKKHFEKFYSFNEFTLLREDQMTASFALEYVDLLWNEEEKDINKILDLLRLAEAMSPNSFDIIQLCAVAYLKIGKTNDAARNLKILVNENYNTSTNAKLLSRLYSTKYVFGEGEESVNALADYNLLAKNVNPEYLFPIPQTNYNTKTIDKDLQDDFIKKQKSILQRDYRRAINDFRIKMIEKYNKIWPVPFEDDYSESYYEYSSDAEKRRRDDVKKSFDNKESFYIRKLKESMLRLNYLDLLNETVGELDNFTIFRENDARDSIVKNSLEKKIDFVKGNVNALLDKLDNGDFTYDDYIKVRDALSFDLITEDFFDEVKNMVMNEVRDMTILIHNDKYSPTQYLAKLENELIEFCQNNSLSDLEDKNTFWGDENNSSIEPKYFDNSIWGEKGKKEFNRKQRHDKIIRIVNKYKDSLVIDSKIIAVLESGSEEFDNYFKNTALKTEKIQSDVFLVIDDRSRCDYDLLLSNDCIYLVKKNIVKMKISYSGVNLKTLGGVDVLVLDKKNEYQNNGINIKALYKLINGLNCIDK